MNKILSKFFEIIKIIFFVASIVLVLFGILSTYSRLQKSLTEAINIFIPFILLFIVYLINFARKDKKVNENILLNFVSCLVFISIIIFSLRSKFDTNMTLYYKYNIGFNPAFFSDNLAFVITMLYCLILSNVFLIISSLMSNEKRNIKNDSEIKKENIDLVENKSSIEEDIINKVPEENEEEL